MLGEEGPFCRKLNFSVRPIQGELADEIGHCLENGGVLMAEAGTGTGKSLAALVPALAQARREPNEPVILSTYTLLLQDQMVTKDLDALKKALGTPVRVVVLKGRGNYLDLEAFNLMRTEYLREWRKGEISPEKGTRGLFLAFLLNWLCAGFAEEGEQSGDWASLFFAELTEINPWWVHAYGSPVRIVRLELQNNPSLLPAGGSGQKRLPNFFERALKFAEQAELVVINHALWFSAESVQKLSSRVIFDEAHHIEEAVTSAMREDLTAEDCLKMMFFAHRLAATVSQKIADDVLRGRIFRASEMLKGAIANFARLFRDCLDVLKPLEAAQTAEARDLADDMPYARKVWVSRPGIDVAATVRPKSGWLDAPAGIALGEALSAFQQALEDTKTAIWKQNNDHQNLIHLIRLFVNEVTTALMLLKCFQECEFDPKWCWWLEEDTRDVVLPPRDVRYFALRRAPVRVDAHLRQKLAADGRASVLLSATLSLRGGESIDPVSIDEPMAGGFRFLAKRLGLTGTNRVMVWARPSPFHYTQQMRVLLRQMQRSPSDPEEGKYLHELHAELLNLIRNAPTLGMALFTSRRHLFALAEALQASLRRDELRLESDPKLLAHSAGQGAAQLLKRYRQEIDSDGQAFLFGTGSFWEGVDLSGVYGLQTLVIVRLPFPAAGDPLVEARSLEVEQRYPNELGGAFRHYIQPLTLLRWRQGVGRLIRNEQSRGVVICLDRRVVKSNYAHDFWQALPRGVDGEPTRIACLTAKKLVQAWADFAAVGDSAEYLEIEQQPWRPAAMSLPSLEPSAPIRGQRAVLIEAAQQLVGEGYRQKESQLRAMEALANGQDVLLTMPTGGGKSLCYQVPALTVTEGLTVVFSPLRALIQDQINDLEAAGIPVPDRAGHLLGRDAQEHKLRARVRQLAEDKELRLLYLTPEMAGLDFTLFPSYDVRRIVIDEAHCLLTWGATFRPDYLRLAQRIKRWRKQFGQEVAIMACSATLTLEQQRILSKYLGLQRPVEIHGTIDRPNLYWGVDIMPSHWGVRDRRLQEVLATLPDTAQAIVYTTYTKTADQVAAGLRRHGFGAVAYHGKMDSTQRTRVLERFNNGVRDTRIIVATKAFGMGINNHRVLLVVHYNHPENLTEYYQQAGRAGRDQNSRALALTLYSQEDRNQHEFLQASSEQEPAILNAILAAVPKRATLLSEKDLLSRISDDPWEGKRVLRQALELLKKGGLLCFDELVAQATLVRDWECPDEPPNDLSEELRPLLKEWLPCLKEGQEWTYQASQNADLDDCLRVEALLTLGVARQWWRIVRTQRYIWLAPGPNRRANLNDVLAQERYRLTSELDDYVRFLEDDHSCRRLRLVAAFNSHEQPDLATPFPCCDVCQVEKGLGHPWLAEKTIVRFDQPLRSIEAEVFTLLEVNSLPDEPFLRRVRASIKGSHLDHEQRLTAYLRQLQRLGLARQHDHKWGLTAQGSERLEQLDIPTWNEVMGKGGRS